jgi:hypothetical protein
MLKFFIALLSMMLLALGGLLYREATFDVDSVVIVAAVEAEASGEAAEVKQLPDDAEKIPLQDYEMTLVRPLFYPDRLPREEQDESGISEGQANQIIAGPTDNIRLSAIIITPEVTEAMFFIEGRSRDVVRVKEGDTFRQWTLSKIEEDRVTLSRGGSSQEMLLRVYPPPRSRATKDVKKRVVREE